MTIAGGLVVVWDCIMACIAALYLAAYVCKATMLSADSRLGNCLLVS